MTPRASVRIRAMWGNDDASSSIKVSCQRWRAIQAGSHYSQTTWAWYEGRRFRVQWTFKNGALCIDGCDGAQHVVDAPLTDLQTDPD